MCVFARKLGESVGPDEVECAAGGVADACVVRSLPILACLSYPCACFICVLCCCVVWM